MTPPLKTISSSSRFFDDDDDEPRSPSSPPPPPPDYVSDRSLPPRPPSRPKLVSSTRRPATSPATSSAAPAAPAAPAPSASAASTASAMASTTKKTQRKRSANGMLSQAIAEERAQKRSKREEQRALKQTALQEARQERIRAAFESHQSTSLGRQSSVKIFASQTIFSNNNSSNDPLHRLRLIYPGQIFGIQRQMNNLITWKRLQVNSGVNQDNMEDVPMCVFVFYADQYLAHIAHGTLEVCAKNVKKECLTTHQIVFAVCGMNRECARRARLGIGLFGEKGGPVATDKRSIQDSYVHLYMQHSIRTHDAKDLNELSNYLCDVTDAIASAPYKKEQDYVSASLRSRVAYANVSQRTIVFDSSQPQFDLDQSPAEDTLSYELKKQTAQVRVESSRDLGNIYLSMLCMILGVTVRKAQAIRLEYPTLRILLDAYDKCSNYKERKQMLMDVRAGDSNRRLGPVLSNAIANVLTSLDPNVAVKKGATN